MNIDERHLLNARIAELMHSALVRIRIATSGGCSKEVAEEICDLADLLHNLPRYVVGHDEFAIDSLEQLRGAVMAHVKRFHPSCDPAAHHYLCLLDMDGDAFWRRYRDHQWGEPEPASASK
jgi:hypothetical protein